MESRSFQTWKKHYTKNGPITEALRILGDDPCGDTVDAAIVVLGAIVWAQASQLPSFDTRIVFFICRHYVLAIDHRVESSRATTATSLSASEKQC